MRSLQTGNGRTALGLHPIIRRIRHPLVEQVDATQAAPAPPAALAGPPTAAAVAPLQPETPGSGAPTKPAPRKGKNATTATNER